MRLYLVNLHPDVVCDLVRDPALSPRKRGRDAEECHDSIGPEGAQCERSEGRGVDSPGIGDTDAFMLGELAHGGVGARGEVGGERTFVHAHRACRSLARRWSTSPA